MIHIKRDNDCPEVKDRSGNCRITIAINGLESDYLSDPAGFDSGRKKLSFDSGIYGHPNIKEKLKTTQHGKCAFCESNITHIDYGDVEHFRPKGGYVQNNKETLNKP